MREALEVKPVAVFNLASEDLNIAGGLDLGELKETVILSTNLVPPGGGGFEALKRYAVHETVLSNGWPVRIGFLGIADPRMVKPNSGFSARDPLEAIGEVLPEIRDNVDLVVVIGEMTEETADNIAGKFPEVYAVLRAERSMRMTRPRQVSNALIMSSVERGRMLGQITLVLDSGKKVASYTYKYVDLNQRVRGNPALEARATELLE
jgi:2',3'-cyclic-nucleotide 2'-phosphodiesterase (5'-nucleotidase family)